MQNKSYGLRYLKLTFLLFWGCWFAVACCSNITDLWFTLGILPDNWHFKSSNYALIVSVLNIYHLPHSISLFLFICAILIESLAAILFFGSFVMSLRKQYAWRWINSAFALSITLWASFLVVDEIFIAYAYESTHGALFMLELLSLMAIHLI